MRALSLDRQPSPETLHRELIAFGRRRLTPALPSADWRREVAEEPRLKLLEGAYLEGERAAAAPWLADLPDDPDAFIAWYEGLRERGPGQGDPLFPWLAGHADRAAMDWFIGQEAAGEAGFEDLLALTQLRLPVRAKLEMARNFWDEMGRGDRRGMHGPMLDRLVTALGLVPRPETTVWQSLALANLMAGLALNRRYAWQSVGALGVIELTAPGRVALVARGLRRLGVAADLRRYFDLHAVLDLRHAAEWNREIIRPLVEADPALMRPIAEGAIMRLAAGARCFERYREELGA
ncbi:MAG TPA: iron-containing redox enzyme family protein [Reyranellaceae bacterium]|nr:iron-containing redox enzyme family protein [Reyranellaceae bacterium]